MQACSSELRSIYRLRRTACLLVLPPLFYAMAGCGLGVADVSGKVTH
jgi:hypothetical protein